MNKQIIFWFFSILILNFQVFAKDKKVIIDTHLEQPQWFEDSFLNFAEDLAETSENKKRLILYFHQVGCPYCDKFIRDNFYDQKISQQVQKYFNVIALDIWGDRLVTDFNGQEITEKAFAQQFKVQYTPTVIFLDEKAQPLNRLNGYYPPYKFAPIVNYVGQNLNQKMPFITYYRQQKQPKASGKLHIKTNYLKAPYDLSEAVKHSNKPLLVLFEQKICQSCDELHQNFMDHDLKKQLEHYQIVLLDRFSKQMMITPKGQKISMQAWANQLNIQYLPSILFFDKEKEIFRLESWLKTDHLITGFSYISNKAYLKEPEFQRYIRRLENEKQRLKTKNK